MNERSAGAQRATPVAVGASGNPVMHAAYLTTPSRSMSASFRDMTSPCPFAIRLSDPRCAGEVAR